MQPRALFLVALPLTLLSVSSGACAGRDAPPASRTEAIAMHEPGDEPGSTRASREAARAPGDPSAASDTTAPSSPVIPTAPTARPLLSISAIAASEGEDGAGNTVAATRPLALDLDARQVPPRALDPVLHVGALRFVRYAHPQPGLMRFVVADRALLTEGDEVFVQYGDETSTRLVLTPALELPAEVSP
ncbi:MAG: hypothetical protein M3Y87_21345 [Myxococcota bacterium]|nr:hypothetical protein [Myxococcota bacterium]